MSSEDDSSNWMQDAETVIRDIEKHVKYISIANFLNSTSKIFFNLTTLEKQDYCVELSVEGFRVVGEEYDSDNKRGKYLCYETPYSMLDSLSPAYRASFGEQLISKLNKLQEQSNQNKDSNS